MVYLLVFARQVMRQARERYAGEVASTVDGSRRYELLRLRVTEGMPIREIAAAWGEDPTHLHRQYARARREFKRFLLEATAFHLPGASREAVERECLRLLSVLKSPS